MKKLWLGVILLIPVLILGSPACKKSQDEEKVKMKKAIEKAVRKETKAEMKEAVEAVRMKDSEMLHDTTADKRN